MTSNWSSAADSNRRSWLESIATKVAPSILTSWLGSSGTAASSAVSSDESSRRWSEDVLPSSLPSTAPVTTTSVRRFVRVDETMPTPPTIFGDRFGPSPRVTAGGGSSKYSRPSISPSKQKPDTLVAGATSNIEKLDRFVSRFSMGEESRTMVEQRQSGAAGYPSTSQRIREDVQRKRQLDDRRAQLSVDVPTMSQETSFAPAPKRLRVDEIPALANKQTLPSRKQHREIMVADELVDRRRAESRASSIVDRFNDSFGSVASAPDMLMGHRRAGAAATPAVSTQTRRIFEQMSRIGGTPVSDAKRMPIWGASGRVSETARRLASFGATERKGDTITAVGRLVGPPLQSLHTPTRAQLISRTMVGGGATSRSAKPYWRRPGSERRRAPEQTPSASTTTTTVSDVRTTAIKGAHRPKATNVFSARLLEEENEEDVPRVGLSLPPNVGFLGTVSATAEDDEGMPKIQFTFSKPLPKTSPSLLSTEGSKNKETLSPVKDEQSAVSKLAEVSKSSDGAESTNKWSCSECFVSNSFAITTCVCCGTKKPTPAAAKPTVTKNDKPAASIPQATKIKAGWTCTSCFISNSNDASKCVCCGASNASKELSSSTKTFEKETTNVTSQTAVEGNKKSWCCGTCFISNDGSADRCLCCQSARPKAGGAAGTTVVSSTTTFGTITANNTTNTADWSCTTCFVSNKGTSSCVACNSPKPGNTYKAVKFGYNSVGGNQTNQVTMATLPPVVSSAAPINVLSSPSKKTVHFAEPMFSVRTITPASPLPSSSSTVTTTAPFTFGIGGNSLSAPSATDKPTVSATVEALPTPPTNTATALPMFGIFKATTTAAPAPAAVTDIPASLVAAPFSFGTTPALPTSTAAAPVSTSSNAPLFAFGAANTATVTTTSTSSSANVLTAAFAPPTQSFGASFSTTTATVDQKDSAKPSTTLPTFGGKKSLEPTSTAESGGTAAKRVFFGGASTATTNAIAPNFSFGQSAPKPAVSNGPSSLFGGNVTDGQPPANTTSTAGGQSATPLLFGAASKPTTATTQLPFSNLNGGSKLPSNPPPATDAATGFAFGGTTAPNKSQSNLFAFASKTSSAGGDSTATGVTKSLFSTKPTEPATQGGFNFSALGQTNQQVAAPTGNGGGFNFASTSTLPTSFSFGGAAAAQPSSNNATSNTAFQFGGASGVVTQAPTTAANAMNPFSLLPGAVDAGSAAPSAGPGRRPMIKAKRSTRKQ